MIALLLAMLVSTVALSLVAIGAELLATWLYRSTSEHK